MPDTGRPKGLHYGRFLSPLIEDTASYVVSGFSRTVHHGPPEGGHYVLNVG